MLASRRRREGKESDSDSPQQDAVRSWLSHFKSIPIPRDAVELKFSRSSGPGGQVRAWDMRESHRLKKQGGIIEREQGQHQSDRALLSRFALDTTLGSTSFAGICRRSLIVQLWNPQAERFPAVVRRIDEFPVDFLNRAPLAVSERRRLPLQGGTLRLMRASHEPLLTSGQVTRAHPLRLVQSCPKRAL